MATNSVEHYFPLFHGINSATRRQNVDIWMSKCTSIRWQTDGKFWRRLHSTESEIVPNDDCLTHLVTRSMSRYHYKLFSYQFVIDQQLFHRTSLWESSLKSDITSIARDCIVSTVDLVCANYAINMQISNAWFKKRMMSQQQRKNQFAWPNTREIPKHCRGFRASGESITVYEMCQVQTTAWEN